MRFLTLGEIDQLATPSADYSALILTAGTGTYSRVWTKLPPTGWVRITRTFRAPLPSE